MDNENQLHNEISLNSASVSVCRKSLSVMRLTALRVDGIAPAMDRTAAPPCSGPAPAVGVAIEGETMKSLVKSLALGVIALSLLAVNASADPARTPVQGSHDLLGENVGLVGYDPVAYFPEGGSKP